MEQFLNSHSLFLMSGTCILVQTIFIRNAEQNADGDDDNNKDNNDDSSLEIYKGGAHS